jgi:hypothetical protein
MVDLSDDVYRRAESLALVTRRKVSEVLADTIEISLPAISGRPRLNRSIADLTDQRVLALTNLQMDPDQDSRLSVLLNKQQAGQLTEAERSELWALMQVYQEQLLQKAQALAEAVRRGLREPLSS